MGPLRQGGTTESQAAQLREIVADGEIQVVVTNDGTYEVGDRLAVFLEVWQDIGFQVTYAHDLNDDTPAEAFATDDAMDLYGELLEATDLADGDRKGLNTLLALDRELDAYEATGVASPLVEAAGLGDTDG